MSAGRSRPLGHGSHFSTIPGEAIRHKLRICQARAPGNGSLVLQLVRWADWPCSKLSTVCLPGPTIPWSRSQPKHYTDAAGFRPLLSRAVALKPPWPTQTLELLVALATEPQRFEAMDRQREMTVFQPSDPQFRTRQGQIARRLPGCRAGCNSMPCIVSGLGSLRCF